MRGKKKGKARKKVRYTEITIRLTTRQKKSLKNYSRSHQTTPKKLIKRAIGPFLENYADLDIPVNPREKLKQLQLFE